MIEGLADSFICCDIEGINMDDTKENSGEIIDNEKDQKGGDLILNGHTSAFCQSNIFGSHRKQ